MKKRFTEEESEPVASRGQHDGGGQGERGHVTSDRRHHCQRAALQRSEGALWTHVKWSHRLDHDSLR